MALEALGAPLPGESAVILAATAAAQGKLDIYAVAAAAFLAAVLGDNIGYLLGRKLGRPVIIRYGARFGLTDAAFEPGRGGRPQARSLHECASARFVIVLRQLNGIVAGTTGMPWPVFLLGERGRRGTLGRGLGHAGLQVRPLHQHPSPSSGITSAPLWQWRCHS